MSTLWFVLLIPISLVFLFLGRKAKPWFDERRHADWFIAEGQYMPASSKIIDDLILKADHMGKKAFVLSKLKSIRKQYGHNGVRHGHIKWLACSLHGEIEPNLTVPSFHPLEKDAAIAAWRSLKISKPRMGDNVSNG